MSKLCYTYVERGDVMKNDKLSVQSMDLAVSIVNLVKALKEQRESVISNQIGRSGTSIGANIREAQYAHGKADFIAKLQASNRSQGSQRNRLLAGATIQNKLFERSGV